MHPRERRQSRRHFLFSSAGTLAALSGADAIFRAADALAGAPMGPGGIPLARRNYPVTLPIYSDNEPIASGKNTEKGPLNIFNWSDYVNPAVVKQFEKDFKVSVKITTFENEEEALSKLATGQGNFDVWFATVDYLSRSVAGKLIQPVNHSYLPNLKNVWPSLQNPFYDVHSRYSVPYTVYTTGIAYRKDKLKTPPAGWDAFWQAKKIAGKVAILDDQREALSMAMLRRGITNINTENANVVNQAGSDLRQLTKLVNVKTNTTDYTDVPTGAAWLAQGWSGDMAGAINYMPKGVPVSVVGYWRPDKGAVIGSDMITILRKAKNPVLAHHFLNYLLDAKHGVTNFSWLGYMPPLSVINPDKVIAQGYIPKNLGSTVVRESDFKNGLSILPLTANGQATWQNAWAKFKAG
jgi:spermidine/putrescine transport system substrate-binding protein